MRDAALRATTAGSRRPGWIAAGVVMVGLAALLGAWMLSRATQRVSVLVAASDLQPGEALRAGQLRVVEITRTDGLRAIQPAQQDLVLGRVARGPVPAGTVLNTDLFAAPGQAVPAGLVVVGSALDPGAVPDTVRAGDPVELFVVHRTPTGSDPGTTAPAAELGAGTVWSVDHSSTGNKLPVAVLVPASMAPAALQAAAEGTLRLALVAGGS